jgi:hypothetical protein
LQKNIKRASELQEKFDKDEDFVFEASTPTPEPKAKKPVDPKPQ